MLVLYTKSTIVIASVVCKYFGKSSYAFSLAFTESYFTTYPPESLGVTSSNLVTLPPLVASVKLNITSDLVEFVIINKSLAS